MKTSKLRVTGPCAGNAPGTGEFPAQMSSNAENASIWWRHHEIHRKFVPSMVSYGVSIANIFEITCRIKMVPGCMAI